MLSGPSFVLRLRHFCVVHGAIAELVVAVGNSPFVQAGTSAGDFLFPAASLLFRCGAGTEPPWVCDQGKIYSSVGEKTLSLKVFVARKTHREQ